MWTYLCWSLLFILSFAALVVQLVLAFRTCQLRTDISMFNHSLAVCFAVTGDHK